MTHLRTFFKKIDLLPSLNDNFTQLFALVQYQLSKQLKYFQMVFALFWIYT